MAVSDRTIRNVFIYVAPKFIGFVTTLLVLPLLTRLVTPEEFGVYALAWLVPTLLVSVCTLGVFTAVPRHYFEYRKNEEKFGQLLFSVQTFTLAVAVVLTPAVWLLADWFSELSIGDPSYGSAIFVAYLAVFLDQMMQVYLKLLQNMEKAASFASLTVANSLITSLGGLLIVATTDLTYMGMLYGYLTGSLVIFLISATLLNRMFAGSWSLETLKYSLRYGIQSVPTSLNAAIRRFFDKYLLNAQLALASVGVYSIALRATDSASALSSAIWQAFHPIALKDVFDRGDRASASVGHLFSIYLTMVLFMLTGVVLFAPEIVAILAPPSYREAIDPLALLSIAVAVQPFMVFVYVQFAYKSRPIWIGVFTIVATVLNVGANLILIPRYGLMGASASHVLTALFLATAMVLQGQRLYRVRYERALILGEYIVFAGAVAYTLLRDNVPLDFPLNLVPRLGLLLAFAVLANRNGLLTAATIGRVTGALMRQGAAGNPAEGSEGDTRDDAAEEDVL